MSLQTFVLSDQTAGLPIQGLIQRAAAGGVEVRDNGGNVIAYVLPPNNREAWAYAEARLDFEQHRDEIAAALGRCGGVTTAELLRKANVLADAAEQQ